MTKPSMWLCAQRRLRSAWVAKDPRFLHADSEYSDQTGRMPRLICFFAGRALSLLVLSRGGSNVNSQISATVSLFAHSFTARYSEKGGCGSEQFSFWF